ncbi:Lrp/AsnC family transcriptional regulator [Candidatus Micrarchaeota archaeon]|nr:Lrp/AsnC family transcriptional regulator [Candidatus Micrarchaeota archaeon]
MVKFKIDETDKHILYLLDTNARTPTSKISRLVRLSKPAVERRIEKMVSEGVITKFQLITNPILLGYEHFKVYIQLQNADEETERQMVDYLKKQNSFWIVSCRGRWDFIFSMHAKDVREFGELFRKFMDRFSQYVLGRTINILEIAPLFNRSYLWPGKKRVEIKYGGEPTSIKVDELDHKILSSLGKNCRKKIVNISEEVGISAEAVRVRMKKLEKKGIIQAYRIGLDLEKIGYENYLIAFKFRNLDSKVWKEVVSFANKNDNIIYLPKTVGSHDLDVEIEVENSKEMDQFIREFRNRFGNVLHSFESAQIIKEHKLEYYH